MSSLDWSTTKTPIISNRVPVICRRNAFMCIYSDFCTKIGCHGNAPFSLVYVSHTWIPRYHKPYLKTKLCMDMLHTTEVMAIFVIFLAKIWLPWQRPLDPCNQKCLLRIGRPRKPPVISNHVIVISRRNVFICIYSNFSPKIGCHGNAPWSLVYGSVTDEFPDGTNPISKPNPVWICRLTEVMAIFYIFGLFWPKFGCHSNVP